MIILTQDIVSMSTSTKNDPVDTMELETSEANENELSSDEAVTSATDADTDFDANINNQDDLEPNTSTDDLTENVEMDAKAEFPILISQRFSSIQS